MTTERFSKEQFEQALTNAQKDTTKPLWEYAGFEKGEHVYKIQIANGNLKRVAILIRSSVKADGFAALAGEDSIRMWLVNIVDNKPLGKKIDAYTTRVPEWETCMASKIKELYLRGYNMTDCPKCDGVMVLRKGKYGEFYGCSNYPRCRNTMNAKQTNQTKIVASEKTNLNNLLNAVTQKKSSKSFEPSKYQQAIFNFIQNGKGNMVVEAGPGSGKSTTIKEGAFLISDTLKGVYLAFNSKIVKSIKNDMPDHVPAKTLHSLGHTNIARAYPQAAKNFVANKVYWVIKDKLENMSGSFADIIKCNMNAVIKLVSLCKGTLSKPTTENLDYLATYYNIETNGDWQQIYQMVKIAFEKSIEEKWRIDYDDMIYWPAIGIVPCEKFDWLLIDELQDLNVGQMEMVKKSLEGNGRILGVGDTWQAIYGWRGGNTRAIADFTKMFNAETLPLSISYRCPRSHIEYVKGRFPKSNIEVWANAKDGVIETIDNNVFLNKVKSGDMVLCRTNAPLVSPAFELIRRGIKAIILGRDIGQGLINLIEKTEKKNSIDNLTQLIHILAEYRNKEVAKLLAQNKDAKAQHLDDSIETIYALSENCDTIAELKSKIKNVFTDNEQGVVFSSTHKAKGMESERVFILHLELFPHPMALKSGNPETIEQEKHVEYVALTRSKSEMYFVQ